MNNHIIYHIAFPHLGIKLSIDRIAFTIGPISVYWYGLILAASLVIALLYINNRAKDYKISSTKLLDIILPGILSGVIGARLYYVIFYPGDLYIKEPIKILYINEGGIAIYGGIIAGILLSSAIAIKRKEKLFPLLDLASLGLIISQAVGRWGNFVNQEAFGGITGLPWGMSSENTLGNTVHPCFLYESLWCIIGFIFLHIYSKSKLNLEGDIFLIYIMWYASGRAFIEGLRTDSLLIPGSCLRISQIISIFLATSSCIMLILKKLLYHKKLNNKKISTKI